jgi:hypothetical protein
MRQQRHQQRQQQHRQQASGAGVSACDSGAGCSVVSSIEASIVTSNHDWAMCQFCKWVARPAGAMPSGIRHERL